MPHGKESPVIAIGGSVAMCRELKEMGFIGIYSIINAPVSLEQAMRQDWPLPASDAR